MQKKIFSLISILMLLLVSVSQTSVAYALENSSEGGDYPKYHFIQYNGEEEEIAINENLNIVLTGWTDESKTKVYGEVVVEHETSKEILLDTTVGIAELDLENGERFTYRLTESGAFNVREVEPTDLNKQTTVVAENENGTSIEEVNTMDDYNTLIQQELVYYKTDEKNQKVEISQAEYETINSTVAEQNPTEDTQQKQPSEDKVTTKEESPPEIEKKSVKQTAVKIPSVVYSTHVQTYGWMDQVADGETGGTTGKNKRMEAIKIALKNTPYSGGITYSTHVQSKGWMPSVTNGAVSGTTGQNKRLESIKINLTGEMATHYDVYYRVHSQSFGWLDWAKNGQAAGTEGLSKRMEAIEIVLVKKGDQAPGPTTKPFIGPTPVIKSPSVVYSTHVQTYGWMDQVADGETGGTTGKDKRMEAIKIVLKDTPYSGGITYSSHVQSKGWMESVTNGAISGTTGQDKRMEAIEINLTDEMATHYDVYYRVHAQSFGWLDWAKNGQAAGTEGLSKRMEAIEVKLVKKGEPAPGPTAKPLLRSPSVVYSTHVQTYGWMEKVTDGEMSGTTGQDKRMEAIKIAIKDSPYSGSITYSSHIQSKGWMSPVTNGGISGTTGQDKRMEAIEIDLTGEMARHYDVYYRVNAQDFGWLDWAKNGQAAGSEGLSKRMEAIEIMLVKKGGSAPGPIAKPLLRNPSVVYSTHVQTYGWMDQVTDGETGGTTGENKRMEAIKIALEDAPYSGSIAYSTHIQSKGWMESVTNGGISGITGQDKRIEAIEINLTGEIANHYDVYYRVHSQSFGWLGWARNGMKAGSEGLSKRIEAIEVKLVPKGKGEPVNESEAFKKVSIKVNYSNYDISFSSLLDKQMNVGPKADGRGIFYASRELVAYYANPNNFVEKSSSYLQFLDLSQTAGLSVQEVYNKVLKGKGVFSGIDQAQAFIDARKKYNINEVYLIAHALHETGNGSSVLSSGVIKVGEVSSNKWASFQPNGTFIVERKLNDKGGWVWNIKKDNTFNPSEANNIKSVYNVFGIGAVDKNPDVLGSIRAYREDWFNVSKAIIGGSQFIANGYINKGQNTLYKMRWNPENPATHQYATHAAWAELQTNRMFQIYELLETYTLTFDVPRYTNQPSASPKPTGDAQYALDRSLEGEIGITTSALNFRTGPSTSFDKITTLPEGNEVTIIGENGGWYKISVNKQEGWVSGNYILLKKKLIKMDVLSITP
ncbi:SH3 domain-containing protein [Virgibacillus halodenitrificans]|uniref:SH3 domain-containing protein n=1 Tax=Virgibacillus halodenitrificans TaxID=1482 RepID=A0ABR7VLN3_VIRHA|nr:SH3 domain-containing protein [Virgibacillus halodenitrificans]MBD1221407.1 SH3 domain-containing protein [Virgibacillus halodenitrificans]